MKKWNRYAASSLALTGLICLFFPVLHAGGMGITVVDLMAYWKRENMVLAVWTAAAVAAPAIAILLTSFGKKMGSLLISVGIELLHIISIFLLCGLRVNSAVWPDLGGTGAVICQLLAVVFSIMGAVYLNQEEAKRRQAERQRQEEAQRQAEQRRQEEAKRQAEMRRLEARRRQEEAIRQAEQHRQKEARRQAAQHRPAGQQAARVRQGSLWIGCGMYQGSSIPLSHMQTVSIGRDAARCNLVVDEKAVSRKHCTITYNAVKDRYLLQDTSSNGTFLEGGRRVPNGSVMELNPGLKFYLVIPENEFRLGD